MTDRGPTTDVTPETSPSRPDTREQEALERRVCDGDTDAYGQIVVIYQRRLFNAVVRMIGDRDEAAEITQETFVRGLEHLDQFRGQSGLYTWLFKIARNQAISQMRKVRRRRTFTVSDNRRVGEPDQAQGLLDRVAGAEREPEQEAMLREQQQVVVEALGRLDEEARSILVMRDIEGFDYQQMADVLELPLGTLKSRLFRARVALREELKGYLRNE